MVKIKIDNQELEVAEGTTVLQAALANKIDVPYFCYHPKLTIAGNCRMCLVNIKGQGKPAISCGERVKEGMEVDTQSPEVKKMQQSVLEFILLNHPLDCPICDQAGECPLQDQYFKFSKFPSRIEDHKIHKPKKKSLGPNVMLDDERCILCTRCVRFCDEVAGTHELCITERGGHVELTTYPGTEMKNPYSLCTVDICPVGALTSNDFRFKKRVWFLKTTDSICTGCATGCNIKMDWDDSIVYRYRPRENEAVNQCWMCDEGRMTYKFINENRALEPMVKEQGDWKVVGWLDALEKVTGHIKEGNVPFVGVLSAQASCEENSALIGFLKELSSAVTWIATRKEVANPSHDHFLVDSDKNPNSAYLKTLATDETLSFSEKFPSGAIVFVLDNLTEGQKKGLIASKPKRVIWFTSNFGDVSPSGETSPPRWADIILPKPTFAEQEGHFINRQGIKQKANKAFPPKGHSRPVWEILKELGVILKGCHPEA